ncbi:MAG: metallophosphoesterase [Clostridia bacterium]|nr:metallophosphoesterase [Clostridia bacterium]
MNFKRNKLKKTVVIILAFVLVITITATIISNACIKVSEYTINLSELSGSVRVVVISDLHGKEYGRDNTRLLAKISEQRPDSIFVVGDMLDDGDAKNGFSKTVKLLSGLLDIAPVYFSYGNQEKEYNSDIINRFVETITENGVVVLDDSFVDCEIGGQIIRVGGTMGHAFPFGRTKEEFENSNEYIFLKDMEKTSLPTVVLAHMPDTFIFNGAHQYWSNIDLVVSGHTHGGVVRLPFVGGVYSPMQGIFPEYDYGFYMLGENMKMVITSGLSGYKFIPRVFNLPEICVLNLG